MVSASASFRRSARAWLMGVSADFGHKDDNQKQRDKDHDRDDHGHDHDRAEGGMQRG